MSTSIYSSSQVREFFDANTQFIDNYRKLSAEFRYFYRVTKFLEFDERHLPGFRNRLKKEIGALFDKMPFEIRASLYGDRKDKLSCLGKDNNVHNNLDYIVENLFPSSMKVVG